MPWNGGTQGGCVIAVVFLVCLAPVGAVAATAAGGATAPATGTQNTGSVTVSSYSVPDTVTLHRNFTVEATVNNTNSSEVEKTIRVEQARDRLWSTIATHNVTVPGNTNETVSFNATIHEGGPTDEQESGENTLLRVAERNATIVEVEASNVHIGPGEFESGWIQDPHLDQGENTTVSARVSSHSYQSERYEFRLHGGVYDTGRTFHRTLNFQETEGEHINAYPRFEAGGIHAVTASGEFLGFVNVSSPNVSVTSVGDLPDTVYEGTEHALPVTVENTGDEAESFAVTTATTLSGGSIPDQTDTRIVTLESEETRTIQRPVRFYALGNQTVSVNQNWSQNVTVEEPVSVTDSGVVGSEYYTGQYVQTTATLTNDRMTTAEKEVDFSLWRNESGEPGRVEARLLPPVDEKKSRAVSVPGGESKTVTVRWFLEFPGTYNASVTSEPVQTIDVTRNPVTPTDVSVPADEVANGSEVTVNVTVSNDGSTRTNRHVSLFQTVPGARWTANVSVPPGGTTTETFTLAVPVRGELSVSLGSNRSLRDSFRVPTPNLTVDAMDVPTTYNVSEEVTMRVVLNNTGTTTERYQIPAVVSHDEFENVGHEERLFAWLDGGSERTEEFDYEFPQPGNYTATVSGAPVNNFTVTTPVEAVNGSLSNDTVEAGQTTTFDGAFHNPTNESQYVGLSVPETGYDSVKQIAANGTETLSWQFGFLQAGTYNVFVHGDAYQVHVTENESWSTSPSESGPEDGSGDSGSGSDETGENDDGTDGNDPSGSDDSSPTAETGSSNGGNGDGGSDGGGSGLSGRNSTSESSTGAEPTGDETETGSAGDVVRVDATTTNGTAIAEASGSANETVAVEIAAANGTTGNGVDENATAVTGVNVSLAADETFSVAVSTSEARPGTVPDSEPEPDVDTVEYVNVSHPGLSDEEVAAASLTLTVGTARLAAMDAAPENVSVYRYADGWERVETTYVGRQGDAHAFAVETPGLSVFAVGVERQSTVTVSNVGLSASQVSAGDAVTVHATVENTGDAAATRQVEVTVDGEPVADTAVELAAGERRTVRFDVNIDESGEYTVAVNGEAAGRLVVQTNGGSTTGASPEETGTAEESATETTSANSPGFGALAAVLAVVVALAAAVVGRAR